jgi:septum formation protein
VSSLILASKSPVRAQLLWSAGVPFEAAASGVNEDTLKAELLAQNASPSKIAEALAAAKALAVAWERDGLIIGADSTIEFEGGLVDKAADMAEARARLQAMRGKTHMLHSAVVVARANDLLFHQLDSARMTMREFSDAWLDEYLARQGEAILGSVGCYQLEGEGVQMFEAIDGDYFTILGLPMLGLLAFLRRQKVIAE